MESRQNTREGNIIFRNVGIRLIPMSFEMASKQLFHSAKIPKREDLNVYFEEMTNYCFYIIN